MTGSLCRRIGPGRLPYATRRDVGGGIAMGATAALATVLWFGGALLVSNTAVPSATFTDHFVGFSVAFGVIFAPLGMITAVVVGTVLWRFVHPGPPRPLVGAILGTCTAVGSLTVSAIGFTVLLVGWNVWRGSMGLAEGAEFGIGIFWLAIVSAVLVAGWLLFPVSAVGGWYHERAKRVRERPSGER